MVRGMNDAAAEPGQKHAPLDHAAIIAIMMGIMLALFLSALEQTIVAPALPTMGRVLGDVENLSWVVTAYLLANTAATPLFGKLSDIHGRRRMMLVAIVIFIVGSVACALAPNMPALIASRALQGIGGGGILPIAHTIIGDMVTPRERPRYQSYTSIMFMAASIIGPVVGGVLTDYVHWTMIFWINLPMGLLALWMTDRALKKLPRHDRPHKLDMLGALQMVCAALALMLAMTWGGTRYPWGSVPILGLLAAAVVLWLLFAWRVASAPEPFIPLAVLRAPILAATTAAGFFSVGVIIGLTIFLPVYFELVLGFSPSGSGTALIVFLAAATVGSFFAGRLMIQLTHYKLVPAVGMVLGIIMLAAFAWKPGGLSLLEVCGLLTIGGAGLGVMYPVTATIVLGGIDSGGHGLTLDMLRGGAKLAGADFALLFRWLFAAGATFLAAGLIAVL